MLCQARDIRSEYNIRHLSSKKPRMSKHHHDMEDSVRQAQMGPVRYLSILDLHNVRMARSIEVSRLTDITYSWILTITAPSHYKKVIQHIPSVKLEYHALDPIPNFDATKVALLVEE